MSPHPVPKRRRFRIRVRAGTPWWATASWKQVDDLHRETRRLLIQHHRNTFHHLNQLEDRIMGRLATQEAELGGALDALEAAITNETGEVKSGLDAIAAKVAELQGQVDDALLTDLTDEIGRVRDAATRIEGITVPETVPSWDETPPADEQPPVEPPVEPAPEQPPADEPPFEGTPATEVDPVSEPLA